MWSLPQLDPEEFGDMVPPRRMPLTALGTGELPPEEGYWEVRVHPGLPPVRLPGTMPEVLVRAFAAKQGRYRRFPGSPA